MPDRLSLRRAAVALRELIVIAGLVGVCLGDSLDSSTAQQPPDGMPVAVDLPGLESAEGVGGSKRAAEKVAASVMIEREGVGGGNDG